MMMMMIFNFPLAQNLVAYLCGVVSYPSSGASPRGGSGKVL